MAVFERQGNTKDMVLCIIPPIREEAVRGIPTSLRSYVDWLERFCSQHGWNNLKSSLGDPQLHRLKESKTTWKNSQLINKSLLHICSEFQLSRECWADGLRGSAGQLKVPETGGGVLAAAFLGRTTWAQPLGEDAHIVSLRSSQEEGP